MRCGSREGILSLEKLKPQVGFSGELKEGVPALRDRAGLLGGPTKLPVERNPDGIILQDDPINQKIQTGRVRRIHDGGNGSQFIRAFTGIQQRKGLKVLTFVDHAQVFDERINLFQTFRIFRGFDRRMLTTRNREENSDQNGDPKKVFEKHDGIIR